jgi:phosphoribosylaminoimidazole-succinocarboxamide synthase
MYQTVIQTDFADLNLLTRGKVRDIYDLGDAFLMVATDRISAFDVVMPNPIPQKGVILTQISLFWFEMMRPLVDNHIISASVSDYPSVCQPYADMLKGRSVLVKKAQPLPIECIVRGYLSGSGWKSYQQNGQVCGIALPQGLQESDRLPAALFTPSTKAEAGEHDQNISFDEAVVSVGKDLASQAKQLSLDIYQKGSDFAASKGIIIADTKFEFGLFQDQLILIDEVLTPDSSRFWPQEDYSPGRGQQSYDKQFVRDYLETLDWDKTPPGPSLPQEIIDKTRDKYIDAIFQLTGSRYGL